MAIIFLICADAQKSRLEKIQVQSDIRTQIEEYNIGAKSLLDTIRVFKTQRII